MRKRKRKIWIGNVILRIVEKWLNGIEKGRENFLNYALSMKYTFINSIGVDI